MKKDHKIFSKQFFIAVVTFFVMAVIVQFYFKQNSQSIEYIAEANKLNSLRTSSSVILEEHIRNNSVTYDPTNGIRIKEVLENLEQTDKKKILILGSSQFVTLNDDWSDDNYLSRVDKLLEKAYKGDVLVHNLSLGGMSIPEKKIVLKKVLELNNYDAIIVSIGPYDSLKKDIRKSISDLEKTQIVLANRALINSNPKNEEIEKGFSILRFNEKVEEVVKNELNNNSEFFENKSAIKFWIEDIVKKTTVDSRPKQPLGWDTNLQDLNNFTGWETKDYKSGSRSLKIVKTKIKTNASWKGYKILLDKPSKEVIMSSWYKTDNVDLTKLFCLDFKLDFEDGTYKWFYKGLNFKTGNNDWTYIESSFKSNKNIIAITPNILFYQGTGALWVDDVEARSVYSSKDKSKNLILNADMEEVKLNNEVYSIEFKKEQWNDIVENSQDFIAYVDSIVPNETNTYLVIPPAYHSEHKTTYSQFYELSNFYSNLIITTKKHNIGYLDASEILNETHFVTYKTGKKKGFIEPLHFGSSGHKILAEFLKSKISVSN